MCYQSSTPTLSLFSVLKLNTKFDFGRIENPMTLIVTSLYAFFKKPLQLLMNPPTTRRMVTRPTTRQRRWATARHEQLTCRRGPRVRLLKWGNFRCVKGIYIWNNNYKSLNGLVRVFFPAVDDLFIFIFSWNDHFSLLDFDRYNMTGHDIFVYSVVLSGCWFVYFSIFLNHFESWLNLCHDVVVLFVTKTLNYFWYINIFDVWCFIYFSTGQNGRPITLFYIIYIHDLNIFSTGHSCFSVHILGAVALSYIYDKSIRIFFTFDDLFIFLLAILVYGAIALFYIT